MINSSKNRKGFTFIELIVAIFIFSLMMLAVAGIFSSSFSGYSRTRVIQKDLEDAQFVMNQMAKTLRTSSIVSASNDLIKAYDSSNTRCYAYKFGSNSIMMDATASNVIPYGDDPITWCTANFTPDFVNNLNNKKMAGFFVTGRFNAVKSESSGIMGKVTVSMSICANASCAGDKVDIQSSVSLRDYYKAGI